MEQNKIIEGNKLIDAFAPEITKKIRLGVPKIIIEQEGLMYHSSWDWLMPVWKKLGGLMYEMRRQISEDNYKQASVITIHILKAFQMADIDSAFNWIIEGVKWYNNQKQIT